MNYFKLPDSTKIGKIVPKNVFNTYINSKQKKLFADTVHRITWDNKLSSDTTNLPFSEINEIQVFKIELKIKENISSLLDLIDVAIPYHIIFLIAHDNNLLVSASKKHPHPTIANKSVIDWTFVSAWFLSEEISYNLSLKRSLDFVFKDLCAQISGEKNENIDIAILIEVVRRKSALQGDIAALESKIKTCKQFNVKVELNLKLQELKKILKD